MKEHEHPYWDNKMSHEEKMRRATNKEKNFPNHPYGEDDNMREYRLSQHPKKYIHEMDNP